MKTMAGGYAEGGARLGLAGLLLLLWTVTACRKEPTPPVPVGSGSSQVAATSSAKPRPAPAPEQAVRCLSGDEIAARLPLEWKLNNPLSVVMIAPDNHLKLRAKPSDRAKIVGALPHDARAIRAQGKVCEQGRRSVWIEVKLGELQGWANAQYLVPTTPPVNKTAAYARLVPGTYASKEELFRTLKKAKEAAAPDPEVPYRAELVGVRETNDAASAVVHQCCYADDAVAGEQVWLDLKQTAGKWRLSKALEITLCRRGATGSRCK